MTYAAFLKIHFPLHSAKSEVCNKAELLHYLNEYSLLWLLLDNDDVL